MSHVRVVFDATALRAYLELAGVSAGELIATVYESGGFTGLPALVITSLWDTLDSEQRDRLKLLVDDPDSPVQILPLPVGNLLDVLALADRAGGDQGLAHAVHEACRHNAVLATVQQQPAGRLLDDYDILDLS